MPAPNPDPQMTRRNAPSNSADRSLLTRDDPTASIAVHIPEISLPKGGGALKGIDEKFEVNAVNGVAGFSIPMPLTAGRNGMTPTLSLTYNSGAGNSPYGLGCRLPGHPAKNRQAPAQLPG